MTARDDMKFFALTSPRESRRNWASPSANIACALQVRCVARPNFARNRRARDKRDFSPRTRAKKRARRHENEVKPRSALHLPRAQNRARLRKVRAFALFAQERFAGGESRKVRTPRPSYLRDVPP
jgi:hypothetical protein